MGQPAPDVAAIVRGLVPTLSEQVHVDRVMLFGSRARGEAADASEVDLLVVSPDFGRDVLADYTLLYRCLPPLEADVLPYTPGRLESAEPDSFLATVLEDGTVVQHRAS